MWLLVRWLRDIGLPKGTQAAMRPTWPLLVPWRTLAGIPKGVYLLLRRALPLRSFEISPARNADLVLELSMNADVAARLKTPERGQTFRSVDEMSAALEREPTS